MRRERGADDASIARNLGETSRSVNIRTCGSSFNTTAATSTGREASLGPHTVRLRPVAHAKAKIETYALRVDPACDVRWQQDPANNFLARLTFPGHQRVRWLDLLVELAVDVRPVNPFDFFPDPASEKLPFAYPPAIAADLAPYLVTDDPAYAGGPLLHAFLRELPTEGRTIDTIVQMNAAVNKRLRYVIREETGIWTPEQTLAEGRGAAATRPCCWSRSSARAGSRRASRAGTSCSSPTRG